MSLRAGAMPGRGAPLNPAVVIHVVAEQATVEGRSDKPAYLMGANTLISAEVVAELARTAKQRALADFTTSGAEAGYRPSRGLADFVRARDLTCRGPGVIGRPRSAISTTPFRGRPARPMPAT